MPRGLSSSEFRGHPYSTHHVADDGSKRCPDIPRNGSRKAAAKKDKLESFCHRRVSSIAVQMARICKHAQVTLYRAWCRRSRRSDLLQRRNRGPCPAVGEYRCMGHGSPALSTTTGNDNPRTPYFECTTVPITSIILQAAGTGRSNDLSPVAKRSRPTAACRPSEINTSLGVGHSSKPLNGLYGTPLLLFAALNYLFTNSTE